MVGKDRHFNSGFSKGLHSDFSEHNQPKDTYRDARNVVNLGNQDGLFSLTYEPGGQFIETISPTLRIIGFTQLENETFLFLCSEDNAEAEIGVVDNDTGNYTKILPQEASNPLGFDIDFPIDAVSRIKITGERSLYFTDNKNPVRFLNVDDYLDEPPADSDLSDVSSLIPDIDMPIIGLDKVSTGGSLKGGVYQLGIRYKDENFTPTSILSFSNAVPIYDDSLSSIFTQIDGIQEGGQTNKSIIYNLSNLDLNYPYYDAVITYYEQGSIPVTVIIPDNEINRTSQQFILNSVEASNVLEPAEGNDILVREEISYDTAKAIEQKDNRLFLANLKDSSSDDLDDLQEVANQIEVKYTIDEYKYPTINPTFGDAGIVVLSSSYETNVDIDNDGTDDGTVLTFDFSEELDSGFTVNVDEIAIFGTDEGNNSRIYIPSGSTSNIYDDGPPTTVSTSMSFEIQGNTLLINLDDFTIGNDSGDELDFEEDMELRGIFDFDVDGNIITQQISTLFPKEASSLDEAREASLNNYKSPNFTFGKKGYRRGEVYSFCFGVIYKNGKRSIPVHIPSTSEISDADTVTKILGKYTSSLNYPMGNNYPAGKVTHHRMPTLQQEPHFKYEDGEQYIRVLGTEFTNIDLTSTLKKKIQGIYFGRQRRNISENRSVLYQGMMSHHGEVSNYGAITSSDASWKGSRRENPFDIQVSQSTLGTGDRKIIRIPFGNKFGFFIGESKTPIARASMLKSIFRGYDEMESHIAFMSPEILFQDGVFFNEGEASIISPELIMEGVGFSNINRTAFKRTGAGLGGYISKLPAAQAIIDYRAPIKNSISDDYTITQGEKNIEDSLIVDPGINSSLGAVSDGKVVFNTDGVAGFEKYLFVKTTEPLKSPEEVDINNEKVEPDYDLLGGNNDHQLIQLIVSSNRSEQRISGDPNVQPTLTASESDFNIHNYLLNLKKQNNSQYGSVSNSEYIITRDVIDVPNSISDSYKVLNGDTFISKFGYVERAIIPAKGYRFMQVYPGAIIVSFPTQPNPKSAQHAFGLPEPGIDARSIRYFFVESNINTDLRYEYLNPDNLTDDNPTNDSIIPYYPKNLDFEEVTKFGRDSDEYNLQYSIENDLKPVYTRPLSNDALINEFPTRIIYSEKGFQDAIRDNYRIFLQENFTDIPGDKGEIKDLFTHGGHLFAHSKNTLWLTSSNERTMIQAQDSEDIILGNGGMFPVPPREITDLNGGYAGTLSQWGGVTTPFGYIFPDVSRGRVYLLRGTQLEEITSGLSRYFRNKFNDFVSNHGTEDNPFNGNGIGGFYDIDRHRYVMQIHSSPESESVSYSFLTQSWASKHDYVPSAAVSINNQVYFFSPDPNGTGDLNTTKMFVDSADPGDFEGVKHNMELEIVSNPNPLITRTYDNHILYLTDEDGTHFFNYDDQSGTVECLSTIANPELAAIFNSERQTTGQQNIVVTKNRGNYIRMSPVNEEFRLAIPRQENSNSRIKGKFLKSRFIYSGNYKMVLHYITTLFRTNYR